MDFITALVLFFVQWGHAENIIFKDPVVQKTLINGVNFKLTTQEYIVVFDDGVNTYGKRMFAEYETQGLNDLENYGFVQFAKGCQFYSVEKNGQVGYIDQFFRHVYSDSKYQNVIVPFFFRNWEVDNIYSNPQSLDPLFHIPVIDLVMKNRHDAYLWNPDPKYSQDSEHFYFEQKPPTPKLYVLDEPGQGFYDAGRAKNVSLQFKTCLYNLKDVPVLTSISQTVDINKALACLDWNESYIYNFKTQQIESPEGIHPHCN